MIRLIEIYKNVSSTSDYKVREVYINPKHVVALRADERLNKMLSEGKLPDDLDARQSFTKVYVDRGQTGIDFTVIGSVEHIKEKLNTGKQLLKG
tara:strand:- start:490 stop:771 length:282 start_codon:yes stop_codon:yes gene_type:complete